MFSALGAALLLGPSQRNLTAKAPTGLWPEFKARAAATASASPFSN
jgi:hypothetical protein